MGMATQLIYNSDLLVARLVLSREVCWMCMGVNIQSIHSFDRIGMEMFQQEYVCVRARLHIRLSLFNGHIEAGESRLKRYTKPYTAKFMHISRHRGKLRM